MTVPTLLYLDFDGALPLDLVNRITATLAMWRWPIVAIRIDKTRRGYHVVVGIRKRVVNSAMLVAAQAILGSDPKREMFNLMRVQELPSLPKFWQKRWNVLYRSHRHGVGVDPFTVRED